MRVSSGRHILLGNLLAVAMAFVMIVPAGPVYAEDTQVLLDHFWGGSTNATLTFANFNFSDTSQTLINIPRGAAVISANVTLEGIEGPKTARTMMDYSTDSVGADLWAKHAEGTDIYEPTVDPFNNSWTSMPSSQVANVKADDDRTWHTRTPTTPTTAPWEYPVQLFHFRVNVTGAVRYDISWLGHGECQGNNTWAKYGAELWLYNHNTSSWEGVGSYASVSSKDDWMNDTVLPSFDTVSSNGSIDVAIVGIHAEVNASVNPSVSDFGHLYTDYIGIQTTYATGVDEWPEDVTVEAFGNYMRVRDGALDGTVDYGSKAFKNALQEHIDHYPQQPGNVTIGFAVYLSKATLAKVEVSDLRVWYDSTGVVPNDPPEWTGPTEVTVKEDSGWKTVIDLDRAFSDDHDEGDLQFSVADVSHQGLLEARVREGLLRHDFLEVRPEDDQFGDVEVVVRASDSGGLGTDSSPVTVHIDPVPDAPWLLEPGVVRVNESERLNLTMVVLDVDMPADSHTFSDTSDLFDIDPATGLIDWTPTADDLGTHTCSVSVEDSFGLTDRVTLVIEVLDVNHRPVITSDLELEVPEGDAVVYWITAEDEDVPQGDTLAYSAWSMDAEVQADAATGRVTLEYAEGFLGDLTFFVRVEDSQGEASTATVTVTVVDVNEAPTIEQLAPQTHLEGAQVSVSLLFNDPDLAQDLEEPEALTISSDGPSFLQASKHGMIELTVDQSMVGEHVVTYTVTDRGGLTASIDVLWSLLNVNEGPVIVTDVPAELVATEDETFTYALEATDVDGDVLSWSDDSPLFDIDTGSGAISFTPDQTDVGTHVVTVTASDGNGGTASVGFDLVVENVNDAPVVAEVLPVNGSVYEEGELVRFSVQATDPDGDALTYLWTEGATELGTGSSLTTSDLSVGTHTITLLVTDGTEEVERTLELAITEGEEGAGGGDGTDMVLVAMVLIGIVTAVLFVYMLLVGRGGPERPLM